MIDHQCAWGGGRRRRRRSGQSPSSRTGVGRAGRGRGVTFRPSTLGLSTSPTVGPSTCEISSPVHTTNGEIEGRPRGRTPRGRDPHELRRHCASVQVRVCPTLEFSVRGRRERAELGQEDPTVWTTVVCVRDHRHS